jgi:hypothetical protein
VALAGWLPLSFVVPLQAQEPCPCKAQSSAWDWKANGYAVADSEASAKTAAIEHALSHGCRESYKYLDGTKLKCKSGCTAGQEARECKPKADPGCNGGSYERDKDMWMFVCRKAKGPAAKTACDATAAAAAPFFSMCDVAIKATATLPCSDPKCS